MYEFEHPFTPPEEGPAMEGVSENGVRWAVYDILCRNLGPEEKAKADREILDILVRAEQRKLTAERMDNGK